MKCAQRQELPGKRNFRTSIPFDKADRSYPTEAPADAAAETTLKVDDCLIVHIRIPDRAELAGL